MSVAKVSVGSTPDSVVLERNSMKPEREEQDSLENFTRQGIEKQPLFSFSRAGDSSSQWLNLLQGIDQPGSSRVSESPKLENCIEVRQDRYLEDVDNRSSEMSMRPKSTSDQMQALRISDAVVAFAQAAARANGEPEKCMSSVTSRYLGL